MKSLSTNQDDELQASAGQVENLRQQMAELEDVSHQSLDSLHVIIHQSHGSMPLSNPPMMHQVTTPQSTNFVSAYSRMQNYVRPTLIISFIAPLAKKGGYQILLFFLK